MDLVRLNLRDFAAAAALALAVACGAGARMVPGVIGVIDDDAVYAVTARSLAEGHGYHLRNLPGEPRQTKYPILYPAVISLLWHDGAPLERNLLAMQAATTAMAALALAMAYLYCVRFGIGARVPAFAGCVLVTSAPNVLFYCSQTLSEMPFLLLLVAALWAVETRLGAPREPANARRNALLDFATGLLLALPLLCRTAGAVFPIAAALVLALRRKPFVWVLAGSAAAALPWALWVMQAVSVDADAVVGYQTDYLGWWRTNASLVVPLSNLRMAFLAFFHIDFEYLAIAAYRYIPAAKWIMASLGVVPWIVVAARARSLAPLPVTMLVYFALLVVWPWPPDRFLVPLFPFLATMLFHEIWKLAARTPRAAAMRLVLGAVFAIVFVTNGVQLSNYVRASRAGNWPYFMWPSLEVSWQSYTKAFDWLRANTEPGDTVASGFDTMTSLYTGRHAIRPFVSRPLALFYGAPESSVGSVEELEQIVTRHHVKYLMLSPLPAYDQEEAFYELVYAASDRKPSVLEPVWQLKEDLRFVIYKVRQDAGARDGRADDTGAQDTATGAAGRPPENGLQKPGP